MRLSYWKIMSLWFKPREMTRSLQNLYHKPVIATIVLVYFLIVCSYVMSVQGLRLSPLFLSSKGLLVVFLFVVFIPVLTLTLMQAITMSIWAAGRCFKRQTTVSQARAGALVFMTDLLPLLLSILFLCFTNRVEHPGVIIKTLKLSLYLTGFAALIFSFISLFQTISETQQLNFWLTLIAIPIVGGIFYGIVMIIFQLLR